MVIRTKPDDGIEKNRDKRYVIGSMAKPNSINATNAGVRSFTVDQPSSWKATIVARMMTAVAMYVRKSNRNDVIQKLDTFTPLTNCSSLAFDTLSWKAKHFIYCLKWGTQRKKWQGPNRRCSMMSLYLDVEHCIESRNECHGKADIGGQLEADIIAGQ